MLALASNWNLNLQNAKGLWELNHEKLKLHSCDKILINQLKHKPSIILLFFFCENCAHQWFIRVYISYCIFLLVFFSIAAIAASVRWSLWLYIGFMSTAGGHLFLRYSVGHRLWARLKLAWPLILHNRHHVLSYRRWRVSYFAELRLVWANFSSKFSLPVNFCYLVFVFV